MPWRRQVLRRGGGHRKEGGILSTPPLSSLGVPPVCQTKEMGEGEKKDRKGAVIETRCSDRRPLPHLPCVHTHTHAHHPLISFSSLYTPSLLLILSSLPLGAASLPRSRRKTESGCQMKGRRPCRRSGKHLAQTSGKPVCFIREKKKKETARKRRKPESESLCSATIRRLVTTPSF